MEDLPTQYLKLIPMVVALVAMLRSRLPQIDGHEIVLGVTAAISVGLCFLVGGDTPAHLLTYGIMVALTAVGGMQALKYHATKSGGTLLPATLDATSIPPPPKMPSLGPQRGFVRLGLLLGLVAIAVGLIIAACAAKPYVCPIVKAIDDACPTVMVVLPDGSQEAVPREQVASLAMKARAQRLGPDAGAR